MGISKRAMLGCAAIGVAMLAGTSAGQAQSTDQFYKGKTVSVVVGYPPGGAYDRYARLMAQFLSRHLPGQPTVIVQNMPGGGTLTAMQYLTLTAPKDGTTIVAFTSQLITQSLLEPENYRFDFGKIAMLGSLSREAASCFTWHALGLRTYDDIVKSKAQLLFGGPAKSSTAYQAAAVLKNLLGVEMKFILGYPGSSERRIAVESGELNAYCGSWVSTPRDWVKDKKIDVFVRLSEYVDEDMPKGLPHIGELAKSSADKQIIDFVFSSGEISKPFAVSAEVPKDRLALLRKAFDAVASDPDFVAQAAKEKLPISHMPAQEAQAIADRISATPPAMIDKAKAILE